MGLTLEIKKGKMKIYNYDSNNKITQKEKGGLKKEIIYIANNYLC